MTTVMASGNRHRKIKQHLSQADRILTRIAREALKVYKDKHGNPKPMSSQQLRLAEVFLRKFKPDLKSVDMPGEIDNEITINITVAD